MPMTPPRVRVISLIIALLALVAVVGSSQEILTALEFFDTVAGVYSEIDDYIAQMTWADEAGEMGGTLSFKQPNLMRIDFDTPEDQVLVSDGEQFMLYVPSLNVVLQQTLRQVPGETPGDFATPEGLELMRRNFNIAYLEGPEPVPLEEDSDILVTQLRLDRKQVTEGFREIVLSVDESGFIRRILGTKVDYAEVQLDLDDIQTNQSIPETRFDYTPEADASVFENFLFKTEE